MYILKKKTVTLETSLIFKMFREKVSQFFRFYFDMSEIDQQFHLGGLKINRLFKASQTPIMYSAVSKLLVVR